MSKKNKVYMHFSSATNVTGEVLSTALGITGGRDLLSTKGDVELVIGWGAKTKKDVALPKGVEVLNHPNAIRANRNKYLSLVAMQKKKVNVAPFCTSEEVKAKLTDKKSGIDFPVIARTNFHQAGKGFWLCMNVSQVDTAIAEGAQYFQNYMNIGDEFRLHMFRGKLLYAQKKVRRDNLQNAFVEQQTEKIMTRATKAGQTIDAEQLKYTLDLMSKGEEKADMIVRSNTRGWRFSNVKRKNVNAALLEASVAALTATGLDFGAVDCCILEDGSVSIIEINSGPGLKETPLARWTEAFKVHIDDILKGKTPAAIKANLAADVDAFSSNFKAMLEGAESEEEVAVLESLWARTAGKGKKKTA